MRQIFVRTSAQQSHDPLFLPAVSSWFEKLSRSLDRLVEVAAHSMPDEGQDHDAETPEN
jgi:hypothetical protein